MVSTDQTANESVNLGSYIPVTLWPHPWPSQSAWRAMIFAASTRHSTQGKIASNGLIECGAVRRVGRRVLVSPTKFFAWVEKQQGGDDGK